MKQQNIDRVQFDFTFNKVKFDVLYFIDEQPNLLAFGIKAHNFYFEVPVHKDFEIKPFFGDQYNKFCQIMGFKFNPDNPFKPSAFFDEFNRTVPSSISAGNTPKPSEIAAYRNNVEEADKIYFVSWRDNTKAGHQVSPENLEKTRKLLSHQAYIMCKDKNISSCWSAKQQDEKPYTLPK